MCNWCCGVDINGKRRCRCRYGCVSTFAILEMLGGAAIAALGVVDLFRTIPTTVRFLMTPDIWAGAFIMTTGFFGMCNGCCHHRGLGVAFVLMSLMGMLLIGASFTISLFTGVVYTLSSGYTCTQQYQTYYLQYSCTKNGTNSVANVYVNVIVAGISLLVFVLNIFGACCGCCTSCRCCGADADIVPVSVLHALREKESNRVSPAPVVIPATKPTPVSQTEPATNYDKYKSLLKEKAPATVVVANETVPAAAPPPPEPEPPAPEPKPEPVKAEPPPPEPAPDVPGAVPEPVAEPEPPAPEPEPETEHDDKSKLVAVPLRKKKKKKAKEEDGAADAEKPKKKKKKVKEGDAEAVAEKPKKKKKKKEDGAGLVENEV